MGLALAQSATDNAANAARMERARRDAANPLRMIIEAASQAKPRGKEAVAAPATPATAAAVPRPADRKPAARAEAASEPAVARNAAAPATGGSHNGNGAAAASGITERVEPLPTASPAPVPVPAPAQAAASSPGSTGNVGSLVSDTLATGSTRQPVAASGVAVPADNPAVPSSKPAAESSLASSTPVSPAAAARAPEVPLKLVRYIEPDLPQRLRSRLKPNSEVTVTFRVNADGSVSDPDIRNSSNRALDPIVIEAVRQWRYEAVPEPRIHAVQLVFNLEN
jgi:TonB family protein